MADVSIEMTGSGTIGDIESWSVTESASPVSIAATDGGVGSVSINAQSRPDSKFIIDNASTFTHSELGSIDGIISDVTVSGVNADFNIAPYLSLLTVERTAPPTGNQPLSEIFANYVALVTDQITVSYTASSNPLKVYGGWVGDVWTNLKGLAAANNVEIAFSGSTMIVRDVGLVVLDIEDNSDIDLLLSTDIVGRHVDIMVQNTELVSTIGSTKYNYSQNPSLESNATGWSGSVTDVTATQGRANSFLGSGSWVYKSEVTATGPITLSTTHNVIHSINISAIPDNTVLSLSVKISATVKAFPTATRTMPVTVTALWGSTSGTVAGSVATFHQRFSSLDHVANYTETISNLIKPGGATTLTLIVAGNSSDTPSGYPIVGDILWVDAVLLTAGSIVPYFDGNSVGCSWLGTTNNSVSVQPIADANDFYNARMDGNKIYTVETNRTVVNVLQTTNYPTFLAQPVQTASTSVLLGEYYVSASNNLPVSIALWNEYKGSVSVSIGDVPGTINLTLKGPATDIPGLPGPYYLGYYANEVRNAAISIAGTGVLTTPELLHMETGADPDRTAVDVSRTVDSPFIDSYITAYDRGPWAILDAAGPAMTLTVRMAAHQLAGFGITDGSLIHYDDSIYRVSNCFISGANATITAKWYVKMGEAETLWTGQTAGAFDTFWSGYQAQDFTIAPLRF